MPSIRGIVHMCNTAEGYGVYVSIKAYKAGNEVPFLLCADEDGDLYRVYLNNEHDRNSALNPLTEKLKLQGRYRKLQKAVKIYTQKGWKKTNG